MIEHTMVITNKTEIPGELLAWLVNSATDRQLMEIWTDCNDDAAIVAAVARMTLV